jgi:TfoX/Sxy family transcriptional regulator of competence genes
MAGAGSVGVASILRKETTAMAFDESLARRIREALGEQPNVSERKMFGGIAFMLRGNMFCGIVKDDLMVRVGPDQYGEALSRPYARPMDFTGRPMKGMVYVSPEGHSADQDLRSWIDLGMTFAGSLQGKG